MKNALLSGRALATAIRELWNSLSVESQLERWSKKTNQLKLNGAAHTTVWTQLNEWAASVEIAFADEALTLRNRLLARHAVREPIAWEAAREALVTPNV